jgi:glycosyltransferase involved in cell wall biosynthesis
MTFSSAGTMNAAKTELDVRALPDAITARVFVMDLVSIVPYYTGHLCTALKDVHGLQVDLGAISYYLDPQFFRRHSLSPAKGIVDVVSRFPALPAAVRRLLKTAEYALNLLLLLVRWTIRRPDVLHVQFLPMLSLGIPFELWFLRVVKSMGIGVVYTVHNVLPQDGGEEHRATYRQVYGLVDRLICHDMSARDRLVAEMGVPASRIDVIPHGPLFGATGRRTRAGARRALGIPDHQRLALWQGILRPYKGVSFLLDAWRAVCRTTPDACLAIVGAGPAALVDSIRREVRALGVESSVRLELRFVTVDELSDFYEAADVLVYPYREITSSGALMTGIGYGKPIVASKLPAFETLLTSGHDALLVDYGDTAGLSAALEKVLDDAPFAAQLGDRVRRLYEQGPHWADIARETSLSYGRVLSRI